MSKTDKELGIKVNEHLTKLGINTPTVPTTTTPDEKIEIISSQMKGVLETLGLDLNDDSLMDTPRRVAKMFVNELYHGLRPDEFPKCTTVENKFSRGEEFILEKNIPIFSDCEHHLRTIVGKAHIAYIPKDKVLGLSKLNRIADYFARRPQVQERLTAQIAHALAYVLESDDVIVCIDAGHMCVAQRGKQDVGCSTMTLSALGKFQDHNSVLRREFAQSI